MLVKDKQIGLIYKVLSYTKTHYLVEDKFGDVYEINKSQAYEIE